MWGIVHTFIMFIVYILKFMCSDFLHSINVYLLYFPLCSFSAQENYIRTAYIYVDIFATKFVQCLIIPAHVSLLTNKFNNTLICRCPPRRAQGFKKKKKNTKYCIWKLRRRSSALVTFLNENSSMVLQCRLPDLLCNGMKNGQLWSPLYGDLKLSCIPKFGDSWRTSTAQCRWVHEYIMNRALKCAASSSIQVSISSNTDYNLQEIAEYLCGN